MLHDSRDQHRLMQVQYFKIESSHSDKANNPGKLLVHGSPGLYSQDKEAPKTLNTHGAFLEVYSWHFEGAFASSPISAGDQLPWLKGH
jgi:hypothetical protein